MESRVEIEYCKNEKCMGHKGPNGAHAHVNLFSEGAKEPLRSPAFGSRKAGTAMAFITDEATATDEEKRISSLISSTVATADLPETFGDDDRFVDSFKKVRNIDLFDMILIFGGGEGHDPYRQRIIDHKQYAVALVGCLNCGADMMISIGGRLAGEANGVRNVDEAKRVLDQATKHYKISTEDDAALREQLPKLFTA